MPKIETTTRRIIWIDSLRGICMILILWFHTEMYYTGHDTLPYELYVTNALCTFYFISGFLFCGRKGFTLQRKLISILRGLLIPYFIFTTILVLPKSFFRNEPAGEILTDIIMGNGSWFVASLIVAEVIYALVMSLKRRWLLHTLAALSLVLAYILNETNIYTGPNIWNFQSSLLALPFIHLGYMAHRYRGQLGMLLKPRIITIFILCSIAIKLFVAYTSPDMLIAPVMISSFPLFLADTICLIIVGVGLTSRLPYIGWLQWVGRHTLIYYFFCGAIPAFIAYLLPPYQGCYPSIILPFLLVCIATTIITVIINLCLTRLIYPVFNRFITQNK